MAKNPVYVMVDVEASGGNMNNNCLLSWAACVVTKEELSNEELKRRGLVYYDELQPLSFGLDSDKIGPFFKPRGFVREAMKVGCLGLRVLEKFKGDPRYDPKNEAFCPGLVLEELKKHGTNPGLAVYRFKKWLGRVAGANEYVVLGSDTSLFDLPWIKYYFDMFGRGRDVLGHSGFNLNSYLRGLTRKQSVKKRLIAKDDRVVAHCAEDDAIYLAKLAREAIFRADLHTPKCRLCTEKFSKIDPNDPHFQADL